MKHKAALNMLQNNFEWYWKIETSTWAQKLSYARNQRNFIFVQYYVILKINYFDTLFSEPDCCTEKCQLYFETGSLNLFLISKNMTMSVSIIKENIKF